MIKSRSHACLVRAPARTRHIARTLGMLGTGHVADGERGHLLTEAGRGEAARDHLLPQGHVASETRGPLSVRRAEGEAFVPLSYGHVFTPSLSLSGV